MIRKIFRILLNVMMVLSLALGFAMVAIWVRSYWVSDQVGWCRTSRYAGGKVIEYRRGVFSGEGRISWAEGTFPFDATDPPLYGVPAVAPLNTASRFGWFSGDFLGWHGERDADFVFGFGSNAMIPDWRVYAIPDWYVTLAFFMLAGVGWRARRWQPAKGFVVAGAAGPVCIVVGFAGIALGPLGGVLVAYGVFLTALFGTVMLMKRVRWRRRRSAEVCVGCGYDLRATPARCPECGMSPAEEYYRRWGWW